MHLSFAYLFSLLPLLAACSQAQGDDHAKTQKPKKQRESLENRLIQEVAPGLRRVGSLGGVRESSGLAPAPQAGSYFTFGDNGGPAVLYRFDGSSGAALSQLEIGAKNHDWESLSHDPATGTYYLADCGNNNNDRQNLAILKFSAESPGKVQQTRFRYPDQTEFPPKKKQRNFDCEASVFHGGQVYLFTKDRGGRSACKVYSVAPLAGGSIEQVANLVTTLRIPGEVTDAALSPDGKRLILLAQEELFVLEGGAFPALLKAAPRRVPLPGAGQTEGATFKDANTLLISTEQGALYELTL